MIMDGVSAYLSKRAEDLMLFKMPKNNILMEEIFSFNPQALEQISAVDISRYTIGLAQFLIYFTSQINASKVKLMQKKHLLEKILNTSGIKAKTKTEKLNRLIEQNNKVKQLVNDMEVLEYELKLTENLEKYYVELINAFKRELNRREFEYKMTKMERYL